MRLTDGVSDALKLSRDLHRSVSDLQKKIDELEFLICEIDDRCKIEFFGGKDDEGRSQEGIKAD